MNSFCTYRRNNAFVFISALLGTAAFIFIFGVRVLDFQYVDWLKNTGNDLSTNYWGWVFFRKSKWFFPFGLENTMAYPYKMSIIYNDSIPLFAVFFKLLSPVLPQNFQYFGLWGILCFALQGVFASKIIYHYLHNQYLSIIGSLFFVFAPAEIFRMFYHTALAGQWLILLALYMLISRSYDDYKKNYFIWLLIGFLGSSIHFYTLAMCGIILFFYCILGIIKHKKLIPIILTLVFFCLIALINIYLLGGFSSAIDQYRSAGFGIFSINLNSFFNPMGWSRIIPDMPSATEYQTYESLVYLGFGMIILLALCYLVILSDIYREKSMSVNVPMIVILSIMSAVFILFALSTSVTLGTYTVFNISLPQKIMDVLNIFRSSARFAWPVMYLIMLFPLVFLGRRFKPAVSCAMISLALVIQLFDISPALISRNKTYSVKISPEYTNELNDPVWHELAASKKYSHIEFSTEYKYSFDYAFADYASKNNMTLNSFYFARTAKFDPINFNDLRSDTIYVFPANSNNDNDRLTYIKADNFIVGIIK